jgi:2-oxo-4-hydroxy-4-carboxy-5-ureidoimidazoline decarboxylase
MVNVEALNALPDVEAQAAFLRCCGSTRWVQQMAARRPFGNGSELLAAAGEIWWGLTEADWLEAFAAHPKIGDLDALRRRFAATAAWSTEEQAGMAGASEAILQALAEGNRQYEVRFGHIFIVCASGKSAEEMLMLLRQRLNNTPPAELRIAAGEQDKITRLRLERLGQ